MQQAILSRNLHEFNRELNSLLMDGWRVVPGSFAATSTGFVPAADDHRVRRLANGLAVGLMFFVVIENDNAN